jgi:hypothetical protein
MEPDDLLCSRNARPQKALVGRAQLKIDQVTLIGSRVTSGLAITHYPLRPENRDILFF